MSATKRIKLSTLEPIKDPAAVNRALGELSYINRQIGAIELEMNEDIDRVKRTAETKAGVLEQRKKAVEMGLEAYGEFNADLFKEKRSLDLTYGSVGFRRQTTVKPIGKGSWQMVLGKLRALAMVEAIKVKEEPAKEVLETYPDERLTMIGCQRVTKDTFYYELNQVALEGQ